MKQTSLAAAPGWQEETATIRIVLALACTLLGCQDPVRDVAGAWQAPNSPGHSQYVALSLEQDGRVLTGSACRGDFGVLIFSGARVAGVYPDVSFTVDEASAEPCCKHWVGRTFRGSFGDDGILKGYFYTDGAKGDTELVFERSSDGLCSRERRI
jgi:hypothetical protein